MRRFLPLLACVVVLAAHAETVTVVPAQSYLSRRQEAFVLSGKDEAAAEIKLKALLAERPDDREVLFVLANNIVRRVGTLKPGARRKAALQEAYQYMVRARAAGSTEPLIATFLAAIKADGSEVQDRFSEDPKLDEAIHAAEDAFRRRDFAKAIKFYQKALEIDPRHYTVTLYLGDAYLASEQYPSAVSWFSKATELNADRETAWRYRGDAFTRMGKTEEALEQYLQALIAEPYNPYPNRSLQGYGQANHIELALPAAGVLNAKVVPDDKGNPAISLPEHFTPLDLAYATARAKWQTDHPPASKDEPYRQTLAEEKDALVTTLKIWQELVVAGKDTNASGLPIDRETREGLRQLQEIGTAGLLEAHVLLARANKDIALDYETYRDGNRGKLHDYLVRYYLHTK